MNTEPGRNEPCWCGSGVKYKKCHWAADHAPKERSLTPEAPASAPTPEPEASPAVQVGGLNRNQIGLLLFALAIGGAIVLFILGEWKWGVASAGAGSLLAGIIWVALDPPPPSNKPKDPTGISFGGGPPSTR